MIAILATIAQFTIAKAGDESSRPIDYNREIRPILSNSCFKCHGPDAKKRKGVAKPLRLDTEEGSSADLGGYSAVVKGKPDESELVERIRAVDDDVVMPPASTGKKLSAKEIELLVDWVRQGALREALGVRQTDPSLVARSQKHGLAEEPDRFLHTRSLGTRRARPCSRGRQTRIDPCGFSTSPVCRRPRRKLNASSPTRARTPTRKWSINCSPSPPTANTGREWLDLARYADSAGYADDPRERFGLIAIT